MPREIVPGLVRVDIPDTPQAPPEITSPEAREVWQNLTSDLPQLTPVQETLLVQALRFIDQAVALEEIVETEGLVVTVSRGHGRLNPCHVQAVKLRDMAAKLLIRAKLKTAAEQKPQAWGSAVKSRIGRQGGEARGRRFSDG